MYSTILHALKQTLESLRFRGSQDYWERRYTKGGDSGKGSYGEFAEFKADVLNRFIAANRIQSVIEFGCGDGNQISLVKCPRYIGIDVSHSALDRCRARFSGDPTKTFVTLHEYDGQTAECALSLDVIFHLVEDDVFADYMRNLFSSASRFVILYTSNVEPDELALRNAPMMKHVRHRYVTGYVAEHYPEWTLFEHIPNRYPYNRKTGAGSFADFFAYSRG